MRCYRGLSWQPSWKLTIQRRLTQGMVEWDVDVLPATSYLNRAHKLAPLCGLMFKSSAGHHPLLAGALGAPHAILEPALEYGSPLVLLHKAVCMCWMSHRRRCAGSVETSRKSLRNAQYGRILEVMGSVQQVS